VILLKNHPRTVLKSPNRTEDYPNNALRLQVLFINEPQLPDDSTVLILCLVLRAINVPSIKKYSFLKRNLFVTVSDPEKTAKTADVSVERQIAKWNQILDPLYGFPLSLQFYG
jgi:hypothetical protein